MRKSILFLMILLLIAGNKVMSESIETPFLSNLMPVPDQIRISEGALILDENFTIKVTGNPDPRVFKAVSRMVQRVAGRTGLFLPQAFFDPKTQDDNAICEIHINRPGIVRLGEDESYTINISDNGINLSSETDLGAMHGMETLLQLLSVGKGVYSFPIVKISDAPRFPWRGLLIDACRHFMPVDVIKRNLDGMAAVKMNVLHWHLSEDQGFRVECKTYPKLHQLGSDGFYYTQTQIKDVINYAQDRGIRVMPEFDMPGHTTSWLVGHPELASAPGPYEIERNWGVFDPTFNPTLESTYTFLDAFYEEMSLLFPDEYLHIGGDENNGKQWDANEQIQAFMKENKLKDNHALQSYFNRRLLKILTRHGKKLMGWDEILHPDLPKNIVIQSWRGRKAMVEAAQQGYQTLLSNGYYIDLIQPTDFHYLNDPEPADMELNSEQRKLILGGEATMWAEMISPETIDSRIWPRTAAIAERFWSPANVNNLDDMYRRLNVVSFRLEELGLLHIKNQAMMLRRLAGNNDITSVKTLVDVIEPVKIYNRNRLRKQFSYTPLTRVVDAAIPDAAVARNFRRDVKLFIAEQNGPKSHYDKIKHQLQQWKENHSSLVEVIKCSPVLKEIEPLSLSLANVSDIGLEALNMIQENKKADKNWVEEKEQVLVEAKTPHGQCELMIVDAVSLLAEVVK